MACCKQWRHHSREGPDRGQDELVDESNRTLILIVLSGFLWFCVASAEAQDSRVELFGGPGMLVSDEGKRPTADFGTDVWISRRWGGSIWHTLANRYDGSKAVVTMLSIRYRTKLYDGRTELHVGASPVAFSIADGDFRSAVALPLFDLFVGRKISRHVGVRFGVSVLVGDGAFVHPMALGVWSFD